MGPAQIENCTVKGNLSTTGSFVTGIVYSAGTVTITGCRCEGDLMAPYHIAGIAFGCNSAIIDGCNVKGSLTTIETDSNSSIAGIVNQGSAISIKNCNVESDMNSSGSASGIYGINSIESEIIENCHVTGNLKAEMGNYGISGTVLANLKDCSFTGTLASNSGFSTGLAVRN